MLKYRARKLGHLRPFPSPTDRDRHVDILVCIFWNFFTVVFRILLDFRTMNGLEIRKSKEYVAPLKFGILALVTVCDRHTAP